MNNQKEKDSSQSDERDASIKVRMGELIEIRNNHSRDGFILHDLSHVDHYFYYTADRKFATYDGWSAAPEDAEKIDPTLGEYYGIYN